MVPNLRDGVTPAGSRLVCPRSERRFSVTFWVRCNGQSPGWASNLCLWILCTPCPAGCVSRWSSMWTCASVVLNSIRCSSLSHVMVTCSPPRPLLQVWGCPWRLALVPAGWGSSLCRRLLFAPCSRWHLPSWWSSLRLRVFGGYWISPLCFHDRRYASRATCSALPPVSRLSFVLGVFSFWLGFGLCLTIF